MRVLIAIAALLTLSLAFSGPTSSYGSNSFRGHLVWGHEVRSFKPCGMEVEYWVVDRTGGELWEVYRALTHEPYQPLYAELRGHLGPSPSTGFGAEDAASVLITNPGGSGTFRHLAAVLNDNGSARNVATLSSSIYGSRNEIF